MLRALGGPASAGPPKNLGLDGLPARRFAVPAKVAEHAPMPDVRPERCKVCTSRVAPGGEVLMRVQLETFVGNIAIPVAVLYWLLLSGLICFFNSDGTSAARAKRMSVGSSPNPGFKLCSSPSDPSAAIGNLTMGGFPRPLFRAGIG